MAWENTSDWIWTNEWSAEDKETERIVYFRKEITLSEVPVSYLVKITAADRYKLYVNGQFVQAGPQKGTKEFWYLDEGQYEQDIRDAARFLRDKIDPFVKG